MDTAGALSVKVVAARALRYVNFTVGTTVRQADVQMIYYPLQHKGPTMTPAATVNDIVLYEKHMSGRAFCCCSCELLYVDYVIF